MTFWVFSLLLIMVALAFILPPLLRKPQEIVDDRRDQNIHIMKHQLAELEADFNAGNLEKETYQAAKKELELTLYDDLDGLEDTATQPVKVLKHSSLLVIIIGLFIPVLAIGMYLKVGAPGAIVESSVIFSAQETNVDQSQISMDNMIRMLEKKLELEPKDVEGWLMLGRSYKILERSSDAVHAYEQATELKPDDTNILLQLADALGVQNEGDLTGRPEQLILKALDKDPENLMGLWLAGVSAKQRGAGEEAIIFWNKMVTQLAPDSEERKKVLQLIADTKGKARK